MRGIQATRPADSAFRASLRSRPRLFVRRAGSPAPSPDPSCRRIARSACSSAVAASLILIFALVRRACRSTRAARRCVAVLVATSMPFWATATTGRFYAPFLAAYLLALLTRRPGTHSRHLGTWHRCSVARWPRCAADARTRVHRSRPFRSSAAVLIASERAALVDGDRWPSSSGWLSAQAVSVRACTTSRRPAARR